MIMKQMARKEVASLIIKSHVSSLFSSCPVFLFFLTAEMKIKIRLLWIIHNQPFLWFVTGSEMLFSKSFCIVISTSTDCAYSSWELSLTTFVRALSSPFFLLMMKVTSSSSYQSLKLSSMLKFNKFLPHLYRLPYYQTKCWMWIQCEANSDWKQRD